MRVLIEKKFILLQIKHKLGVIQKLTKSSAHGKTLVKVYWPPQNSLLTVWLCKLHIWNTEVLRKHKATENSGGGEVLGLGCQHPRVGEGWGGGGGAWLDSFSIIIQLNMFEMNAKEWWLQIVSVFRGCLQGQVLLLCNC